MRLKEIIKEISPERMSALSFCGLHKSCLKMQSMNIKLKFQPSVTLSSGEGPGEVLKAALIGRVLMLKDHYAL